MGEILQLINNINIEGTMSQIYDIGPRFICMSKNRKIWVIFKIFIFYIS